MFPEFSLNPQNANDASKQRESTSAGLDDATWEHYLKIQLKPEEKTRLELLLLERLKQHKTELAEGLKAMSGHWTYEDPFYRYYHGSFKVYHVQDTTQRAIKLLRKLLPERELNSMFEQIINDGTGKVFDIAQNEYWNRHVRPMLEAFAHAKYMIEMALRYADLAQPPQSMPSGYAALLYLYNLR